MSLMSTTAHVRKHAAAKRHPEDYYKTPPATTEALLAVEEFPTLIAEPACGDGAISKVLIAHGHVVISSDLLDRGFAPGGQNFLQNTTRVTEALITNPPFGPIDEFTLHALKLGYEKIAILARLPWLEGVGRHKRLWSKHPPARIWAFSNRQTLWRGDEESKGKGGAIPFAWFIFEQGNQWPPQIGWIQSKKEQRNGIRNRHKNSGSDGSE
jgi:hypothetical protein